MLFKRPLFLIWLFLGIVLAGFLAACSAPGSAIQLSKGITITCEVFYRAREGEALKPAPIVTFSEGTDHKYLIFADMTFNAMFQDDRAEGQALFINVTGVEATDEFSRQLYQFDSENPPDNQFIGGHGFTGLHYIYHPVTRSEMQYFCSLQ